MSKKGVTRREVLSGMGKLAAGAAAAPLVSRMGQAAEDDVRRPNILLIVVDDLGYADLGCYGSETIETPNLDKLAQQGVRFSQYYVAAPLCAPFRVSLMTGKCPQRTSLAWNPNWKDPEDGLSPDETTIAEVLRDAGYHTALIGKWHFGYAEKFRPRKQGFMEYWGFLSGWADYYEHTYREGSNWMFRNDEPHDEPGYMTDLLTREAMSYVDRHKGKDEPFFLYVAYNAPHGPMQAPPGDWMDRAEGRVYDAIVEHMDDSVGKLIKHLDDSGLGDNTLVVWMSDNGGCRSKENAPRGSNAPLSGHKGTLWEGGIRVPFIARWPGRIPAGTWSDDPIVSVDMLPTFAELGGAKLHKKLTVDGKDVLPVLQGKEGPARGILFWQHGKQTAARQGDLKLLREEGKPDCLFNVVDDPGEKHDLVAKYPKLVVKLSAELDTWLAGLKKLAEK